MIPRKATAAIFLAFSVVVAFKHYIIGEPQYTLLTIPFFAALISNNKISKYSELIGLLITSCYIMAFQVFHVGMVIMIISTVFFFTFGHTLRIARVYILVSIVIVFMCSYFQFIKAENMLFRAVFDSALYAVLSFTVYIALQDYISSNVIDAVNVAKEAIKIAKKEIRDGRQ